MTGNLHVCITCVIKLRWFSCVNYSKLWTCSNQTGMRACFWLDHVILALTALRADEPLVDSYILQYSLFLCSVQLPNCTGKSPEGAGLSVNVILLHQCITIYYRWTPCTWCQSHEDSLYCCVRCITGDTVQDIICIWSGSNYITNSQVPARPSYRKWQFWLLISQWCSTDRIFQYYSLPRPWYTSHWQVHSHLWVARS